jgi:hypothetical protein
MVWKREEYIAHMGFEFTGKEMFCELLGPLVGLKEEWQAQGATEEEISLHSFGWDNVMNVWIGNDSAAMEGHSRFGIRLGPVSGLAPKVLEDNAEYRIVRDILGRRTKLCKSSGTVPLPLEYPVRTMDDWQRIKPWYEYREDRVNREKLLEMKRQQEQGCLTIVGMLGGFDEPRQLMGEEEICVSFYEQPEMIEDMLTTFADTAVRVLERVVEVMPVDCLFVHEDLAGKSGPLIGPKQVRQFILPYYRRIWDFLKVHGTRIFSQDSDGMIEPVIDDFLACGVNAFFPFEPGAGMDMVRSRKKYGRRFAVKGGIDKYALRGTKEDIRRELGYKMCDLTRGGGTIFCLDHRIPNGVPVENYRYYVRTGREILGLPVEQKGAFVWMGF